MIKKRRVWQSEYDSYTNEGPVQANILGGQSLDIVRGGPVKKTPCMYKKRIMVAKRKKYSQPPIFFSCSYRGWPTLREPPFSSPASCSASQSQT